MTTKKTPNETPMAVPMGSLEDGDDEDGHRRDAHEGHAVVRLCGDRPGRRELRPEEGRREEAVGDDGSEHRRSSSKVMG